MNLWSAMTVVVGCIGLAAMAFFERTEFKKGGKWKRNLAFLLIGLIFFAADEIATGQVNSFRTRISMLKGAGLPTIDIATEFKGCFSGEARDRFFDRVGAVRDTSYDLSQNEIGTYRSRYAALEELADSTTGKGICNASAFRSAVSNNLAVFLVRVIKERTGFFDEELLSEALKAAQQAGKSVQAVENRTMLLNVDKVD